MRKTPASCQTCNFCQSLKKYFMCLRPGGPRRRDVAVKLKRVVDGVKGRNRTRTRGRSGPRDAAAAHLRSFVSAPLRPARRPAPAPHRQCPPRLFSIYTDVDADERRGCRKLGRRRGTLYLPTAGHTITANSNTGHRYTDGAAGVRPGLKTINGKTRTGRTPGSPRGSPSHMWRCGGTLGRL